MIARQNTTGAATEAADELHAAAREHVTSGRRSSASRTPALPSTAGEFLGAYRTVDGHRRRLVLATIDGARQLLDCAPGDRRVVQCFGSRENLLQIAAVAREYLQHARDDGRPLVAGSPQ